MILYGVVGAVRGRFGAVRGLLSEACLITKCMSFSNTTIFVYDFPRFVYDFYDFQSFSYDFYDFQRFSYDFLQVSTIFSDFRMI